MSCKALLYQGMYLQLKEGVMKRICSVLAVCAIVVFGSFAPSFAQTQEAAFQVPVNDDGIEAVTIEMVSGTKVVVYVLRETATDLYVQNLNDSMEVSVPRSKIASIRKPTEAEVNKVQKRLRDLKNQQPAR